MKVTQIFALSGHSIAGGLAILAPCNGKNFYDEREAQEITDIAALAAGQAGRS
jgi:hypothetical protein